MPNLDGLNFKDFLCFIAFALVRRCAIRPGALTFLKIGEFLNPIYKDEKTVLIHVKGKYRIL